MKSILHQKEEFGTLLELVDLGDSSQKFIRLNCTRVDYFSIQKVLECPVHKEKLTQLTEIPRC